MKWIELILDTNKHIMVNLEDVSYVFQNQRGYGVVVMKHGADLPINMEYGNLIQLVKDASVDE